MRAKFITVAVLAIGCSVFSGLGASGAFAEDLLPVANAAGAKKIGYSATLMLSPSSSMNTACNIGYSSTCGSGNCKCALYGGSGMGPVFGSSNAVSLALTVDIGEKTTGNACFPAFGALSIPGSKDTETIDVSATLCGTIPGGLLIMGGFQFHEPSSKGIDAVGALHASAPSTTPSKFLLKLSGKAIMATLP